MRRGGNYFFESRLSTNPTQDLLLLSLLLLLLLPSACTMHVHHQSKTIVPSTINTIHPPQKYRHPITRTMHSSARNALCMILILPLCQGLAKSPIRNPFKSSASYGPRNLSRLGASTGAHDKSGASQHVVHGVECVEVPMDIPSVGRVVVLEATAEAQIVLVDLALEDGEVLSEYGRPKLNAGDPYGSVLWPAAYAVAANIMEDSYYKSKLEGMTVVELGTGTGLVSLALSLAGTQEVIATDYENVPLRLLEYAATNLNGNCPIQCRLLDMKDYESPLPQCDLVVAADIMYEPVTGIAMAQRAVEAMKAGARVLVGDSPGRPGRQAFLEELERLGVMNAIFTDTVGFTCSGYRHELICGKDSTSVSNTPKEMLVAIMELDPTKNLPS